MKGEIMTTIQKGVGVSEKMPEPDPDELARQSLKKIKNKFIVMKGYGHADI